MSQRPDIHGTREELVAFIADQQAEIGRLRFMGNAKDNANKAYAERNAALAEEIKRVRGRHERDIAAMADMVTERDMEVERLRTALEEYACTGTDHPCGCYDLLSKEKTEIERLRKQRMEFDCRYTMGSVADIDGSHCPFDQPCMRCQIERLKTEIERLTSRDKP